ncbi:MAG: 2-oxoglutarate dehydrogenase E1 component [Bacteroidales bacterium]|jgi:2-oxoglutarate dehydrogenase E1 component|nr:2-oxoglutarate dehydrogenase E1 component [Bacteroidales bacterium]
MDKHSYLSNAEPNAIEQLYEQYLNNSGSLDPGWQKFFEGFEFARKSYTEPAAESHLMPKEFKVINLINNYRERGHLFTKTNPVRQRRRYSPTLDIENFGLSEKDLDTIFEAGSEIGIGKASLKKIVNHLQKTYCQSIGAEFAFIRDKEAYEWLKTRMETSSNTPTFSVEEKKTILRKLAKAVFLEKFFHRKFVGQKRFSLEGAESIIPGLNAVIEYGVEMGVEEIVLGMAHRGRLNVLANIMQKSYQDIFNEFQQKEYEDETVLGDVKYHLGYTSSYENGNGKKCILSLCPNPSHLESVNPVVEGIARSRIDSVYGGDLNKLIPILIHGDASVAGQGIVYEILQMSGLPGYKTGGTIHLVINNQVGFTTNYLDSRTSIYCTDIAKTTQSPVFHVNGDDVEALTFVMRMALEYRAKFNNDVFIDLLCYRKYGHNEGDEPRFTQPILYKIIEKHPDPYKIYSNKLISEGVITDEEARNIETDFNDLLEKELEVSHQTGKSKIFPFYEEVWKGIRKAKSDDFDKSPVTAVSKETLMRIGHQITEKPQGKVLFRKLERLLEDRRKMLEKTGKLDWAMGELLAYGTLLDEGIPVRLSGQDSQRGTFSHRHSVLTIEDSEERYVPLNNISKKQAYFSVYNSSLSEYGVLGFEYGYSLVSPNALAIWEAQFGDFNNGAQIIIDQYISSAEEKWRIMNDLVMLLPHGYEGQGPEHSSGRMERFLNLCADNNMQVANCTTPANFFHLLRRQLYREIRKPLIVFTPKSLLRHPACVSPINDFITGGFKEVIEDDLVEAAGVKRVILCSGKIYYELVEEREKTQQWDVVIIRVEQLYPFPEKQLDSILSGYPLAETFIWVQEEPANMGAWTFISKRLPKYDLILAARPESGSPATGSISLHNLRQRKVIEKAFGECDCHRSSLICKMICAPKEWRPALTNAD